MQALIECDDSSFNHEKDLRLLALKLSKHRAVLFDSFPLLVLTSVELIKCQEVIAALKTLRRLSSHYPNDWQQEIMWMLSAYSFSRCNQLEQSQVESDKINY